MRLLLDTHAFLWFVEGNAQLSAHARALIEDASNEILLSVASIWEIAIKYSLGKLSLTAPVETFITQQLQTNAITTLDVRTEHVIAVATLPFHHRDPFDRLLIAQAQVENVPISSADTAFDPQPSPTDLVRCSTPDRTADGCARVRAGARPFACQL